MTDLSTCKHCGETITARHQNGSAKTFCSSRCNGDYRRALNRQRNKDMADRAEAVREHNTRLLEAYLTERRRRLATLLRTSQTPVLPIHRRRYSTTQRPKNHRTTVKQ